MEGSGWSEEVKSECESVFRQMDQLMYEVRNCVRGSYTKCDTPGELSDHLDELAHNIAFTASCIRDNCE